MIIAVTGHRPESIKVEKKYLSELFLNTFLEAGPDEVIVGMASGIDLWAGRSAVAGCFSVTAAVPWKGHKPRQGDESEYDFIMQFASKIVYVNEAEAYPGPQVYAERNHYMVDNATHLLAYYNGQPWGGTCECVEYAKGKIPMRNLYDK